MSLIKLCIPNWQSPAILNFALLTLFLVFRTYLSIWIAGANGRIVRAIVELDIKQFGERVKNIFFYL